MKKDVLGDEESFSRLLTLLPFLYMIAIWVMSSLPDDVILDLPSSPVDRFIKEALHLVEFAILYMLLVAAFAANHKLTPAFKPSWRRLWLAYMGLLMKFINHSCLIAQRH